MSTPIINAIENVNQSSLNSLFQSVANNPTATNNLLGSNRNIDAVGSSSQASRGLGNNGGDDDVVRRALCQRTGRDPTNFPSTATDIVNDTTFRDEIFADESLSGLLSGSQPGMAEVASSTTFSNEMVNSEKTMSKVAFSQTAMGEVAASQTAMQEVVASQTALQEITSSQTAMGEIASSQTAMQEVANSQTAMQEIAASQTAMQEVAASQTAMAEIANSQTAISAIGSNTNENIAANTVLNSSTSTTEFQNSSLKQNFTGNFNNGSDAGGTTITNSRVLVTSNNNGGDRGTGISFSNDVGPETQGDTTFIANEANVNDGNSPFSGSTTITGIEIN